MNFADLHCDTPFELFKNKADIINNQLHISIDKCKIFDHYIQIAAIWCDQSRNNESCYMDFYSILDYFKQQASEYIRYKKEDMKKKEIISFIIAVEDARLLNNKLKRIKLLYRSGVRFITLTWKNTSCIGGAWNSNFGLTDFGKNAVIEMFQIGIIPDVSHGSKQLIKDVYDISKKIHKPFCATHSNSFSIYPSRRNLTDECARMIADSGGLIGISFCPCHLSENASVQSVINHVDHYLSIVGENAIAFGCDFDGISSLPRDIYDITSIEKVYWEFCRKFGYRITEKIFYNNTYNFLLNNI